MKFTRTLMAWFCDGGLGLIPTQLLGSMNRNIGRRNHAESGNLSNVQYVVQLITSFKVSITS
jgi:hypothetical protein